MQSQKGDFLAEEVARLLRGNHNTEAAEVLDLMYVVCTH